MIDHAPSPARSRRREGFPGQHLVVIPAPHLTSIADDPLLSDLIPIAAGSFHCALGHLVQRRVGIPDYILILVRAGKGWICVPGRSEVRAGQLILIPAGIPHSYGADDCDPWSIQWVHFQGRSAAAFAKLFTSEPPGMPLNIPPQAIDRWELSPLYELLEQGYTQRNVLGAAAHLRMVLTELHRQMVACAHATSSEAITESLRWMRKNLNRTVTLPELAAAAGLSIPHYSCLFKLATGFSPIEHFLRLRIQRACQLLDLTNLRVGEIAAEVGWSDPYYFSRAFRRIIGKSPRAYREVAMG